jgi:E3 ubiquitin-protein ligase HUWE1
MKINYKAILEKFPVNVNLNRALLKKLLGIPLVIGDLDDIDAALSKNIQFILENDITDLGTTFIFNFKNLEGQEIYKELIPDGHNIEVTEENKKEFVKKFCDMRIEKLVEPQLEALIKGFQTILPRDFTYFLRSNDLDLMIAGEQHIDVTEMKAHVEVEGNKDAEQVKWLFEILEEYTQEQLSSFLQFVTGNF